MTKRSAVALTFPGIHPDRGYAEYVDWPTRAEIDHILEHTRRTGIPEDYPRLGLNPPELSDEHHIIGPLAVPFAKRPNGKYIWCAICQTWKFQDGRLLYTPSEGAIRPIGNDCARGHFGVERWEEMQAGERRRDTHERNRDFLIAALPSVSAHISRLLPLAPTARRLQDAHSDLFREASEIAKLLVKTAKSGGALTVDRERNPATAGAPAGMRTSGGGESSAYETVRVGSMRGLRFLAKTFRPTTELRLLVEGLREFEAFRGAADMTETEVNDRASRLDKLFENGQRLEAKIADASEFLSQGTFEGIAAWLRDTNCPCAAHVVKLDERSLVIREHGGRAVTLTVQANAVRVGQARSP